MRENRPTPIHQTVALQGFLQKAALLNERLKKKKKDGWGEVHITDTQLDPRTPLGKKG